MSTSDTPRTDAARWTCTSPGGEDTVVDAEFARTLERENARLREALEEIRVECDNREYTDVLVVAEIARAALSGK